MVLSVLPSRQCKPSATGFAILSQPLQPDIYTVNEDAIISIVLGVCGIIANLLGVVLAYLTLRAMVVDNSTFPFPPSLHLISSITANYHNLFNQADMLCTYRENSDTGIQ